MTWGTGDFDFHETRAYNSRLQLTRLTAQAFTGAWATDVDLEYRYSATQNNGQITQFKDWMTGEEVSYSYDSLSRLISAVTTGPEWGQSYAYDGFGNRTSVTVTKGTAPAGNLSYDGLTNHITNGGFSYDANGSLVTIPGLPMSYDIDNRLACAGSECYSYDADNRRVWKGTGNQLYFYGVDGRRMGTYQVYLVGYSLSIQETDRNLYFAGRLIASGGKWVATDRLGSVVKRETERLRYFPWGEEQVTTTQNRDKFGTYYRDSTGLDYAMNRYYASQHGRFLTPDPYRSPSAVRNPIEWNRYLYVIADPVNLIDPWGLDYTIPEGGSFDPNDPRNVQAGGTSITVTAQAPGPAPRGGGGPGGEGLFADRDALEYEGPRSTDSAGGDGGGGGGTGGTSGNDQTTQPLPRVERNERDRRGPAPPPPTDPTKWSNPLPPPSSSGNYEDYAFCVLSEWSLVLTQSKDFWVVQLAPAIFVGTAAAPVALALAIAQDVGRIVIIRETCDRRVYGPPPRNSGGR